MLAPILALWTTLPFLALSAGGLTVDTPSPDALCPPLEQTRSIVESRLGTIELEGTWRATYVLVHRERGDVVTLKLRDPAGRVRLEREFAAKDGTCATLAQVIALVLERYFVRPEANVEVSTKDADASKDRNYATQRAADAPLPATPQKKEADPAVVNASSNATGPTRSGHSNSKLRLTLDTSLWVSTAWVAPTAGVGLRLKGSWALGLTGGYDLSAHAQPISRGWGKSRRIPLVLQVKYRLLPNAPLQFDLGAELLGLYEHAHTEGLLEDGSASRAVPGLGLRLGAELPRARSKVFPFLELSSLLLLRTLSRPFEVDHRSAFALPTFVFGLDFGIRTTL